MSEKNTAGHQWLHDIWLQLASAPKRRREPFRIPAMATISVTDTPHVRQVVLRRADASQRIIEVHTDLASAKFESLTRNPAVEFCFWNPRKNLQVRASGAVTMQTKDDAQLIWEQLSNGARRTYSVEPPTGCTISKPHDYDFGGEPRFVRILSKIDQMDILSINPPKHQRMKAHWSGEAWITQWVVP